MRLGKSIEEHCADFILLHRGEAFKEYRKRCLKYWREHYGVRMADKIEAMVKERWGKK